MKIINLLHLGNFMTAAILRVFQVVALSAQLSGVSLSSLLPVQQLSRIAPSQWLAPLSGMGYLWQCDCYLPCSITPLCSPASWPF